MCIYNRDPECRLLHRRVPIYQYWPKIESITVSSFKKIIWRYSLQSKDPLNSLQKRSIWTSSIEGGPICHTFSRNELFVFKRRRVNWSPYIEWEFHWFFSMQKTAQLALFYTEVARIGLFLYRRRLNRHSSIQKTAGKAFFCAEDCRIALLLHRRQLNRPFSNQKTFEKALCYT